MKYLVDKIAGADAAAGHSVPLATGKDEELKEILSKLRARYKNEMAMEIVHSFKCHKCGTELTGGAVVCPNCEVVYNLQF